MKAAAKKPVLSNVLAFKPTKPIRRRIVTGRISAGKRVVHLVEVVHTNDPKQNLLDRIGDLPQNLVQFSRILVAIYQPPMVNKTAGGIIITDDAAQSDIEEYLWQGKVGLIVAMGPQAYQDDENTKFHGTRNKVGDWVWFRPSNGDACDVNEVPCRVFSEERHILGTIPHPDYVW